MIKEVISATIKLVKFDNSVFLELNQMKARKVKDNHLLRETSEYRKVIKYFLYDFSREYSFDFIYTNILLPEITQTINEIKKDINNLSAWASLEAEIFSFGAICRGKMS